MKVVVDNKLWAVILDEINTKCTGTTKTILSLTKKIREKLPNLSSWHFPPHVCNDSISKKKSIASVTHWPTDPPWDITHLGEYNPQTQPTWKKDTSSYHFLLDQSLRMTLWIKMNFWCNVQDPRGPCSPLQSYLAPFSSSLSTPAVRIFSSSFMSLIFASFRYSWTEATPPPLFLLAPPCPG